MLKAEGLEYEANGAGEAVLLIHGGHIADAFLPLMREAALADPYRLIRYRRRGFAGSDPHSGPFSIEQQAQDALALLKHLGVERAHLIGHSYGGAIAVQLAIEAPQVVHSLVLLEPAIFPAEIASASRISQPILYAIGSETLPLIEIVKQHFQSLIPHTEQVVVPGVNHSMQMQDPKRVAAAIADFLADHPL